ncbi:hypothetical protein [Shewanella surugensis]|uniref:MSHA biogenesis protein MshK n=1 Tax=Shewanella surugensis TaxID=212020 RepID=A0ABT0LJU0_9GAMM|nr:hypothetical protein [Shewanella surugensis]MCL1127854.1 hypothetical protein [Shewanella surugensis]
MKTICMILLLIVSSMSYSVFAHQGNGKGLPPGLQKKVDQGKPLPPGWQKKLSRGEILSQDLYLRGSIVVPLNNHGVISIQIQGTVIELYQASRQIINIFN